MAELLRNEVAIYLANEERVMRATFSAIRAIEATLGKSITAIINKIANSGDISMTDAATVIYHGLRGYNDTRLTLDQVGEAIMEEGLSAATLAVVEFTSKALSGVSLGKSQEAQPAK